jgi:hypothetical protein
LNDWLTFTFRVGVDESEDEELDEEDDKSELVSGVSSLSLSGSIVEFPMGGLSFGFDVAE